MLWDKSFGPCSGASEDRKGLFAPDSCWFNFAHDNFLRLRRQYDVKFVGAFLDRFNFDVIRENYTECLLDRSFRVGKQLRFEARILPSFFHNLRLKERS